MTGSQAIAAVTAALRRRLEQAAGDELPGTRITTRPLDKARDSQGGNQVNLFLYLTLPNAATRNLDSGPFHPAAPRRPLLALNLHYLISVYGQDEDDAGPYSHRLLGNVMQALHSRPVMTPAEIEAAAAGCDFQCRTQRVSISLQTLSADEMTKLWSAFQTQYRLSVAYEVSVVLLDDYDASSPE